MVNTAPAPAAIAPRADFADWLSPMLVKELRQGVRTKMFVAVFILLQVAMLLDLSLSLLVAASHLDASEGTIVFWVLVCVPVLLIVPFTGLNAIGSEVKANTLELIFLTRLTAFRIVLGKWLALFAQSLLLVCATLPYLVLRYFMGGVNIAGELLALGTALVGSALLTALTVGLSAYPTRLVRPLVAVGGLFLFFVGAEFLFMVVLRGRMGTSIFDWLGIVTALLWATLLMGLLLDAGAARIAPPAENHTGFMRAVAVAGLGLAAVLSWGPGRFGGVAVGASQAGAAGVAFFVAVVVCAVAVCEQPRAIPSLYRPFVRRGWAGRTVGRFFYPGWPSGVLFTLAVFGGFAALFARLRYFNDDEAAVRFVAALGTLLLPTALARTVLRRFQRPVATFFLVQVASVVVLIFCSVCDNALGTQLKLRITAHLPLAALVSLWPRYYEDKLLWALPVLIVSGLSALVTLAACVPAFRQIRGLERASLDLPDPSTHTPPAPAATEAAPHVPLA